jgi:hypothetical protein
MFLRILKVFHALANVAVVIFRVNALVIFGNIYLVGGGVWEVKPGSTDGAVECYPSEGDHVIEVKR